MLKQLVIISPEDSEVVRSAFRRVPSHIPSRLAAPGRRASEQGLARCAWSLDRVGARPALLNFFTLKPTTEAAEAGASVSTVRVSLTPLVCVCSGRTKTGVPAPRNQQERGSCTCRVLSHNWFHIIRIAAAPVVYVFKEAVLQPPGELSNACEL